MSSEAFVTLATNDGYGLGALVLAESIRQVGTKRSLVILISNHLSDLIRKTLEISFDEVIVVDELNSNDIENLTLLSRPELGITFTKINCWLLEQYTKCVFLDADCVVLRSIDDLFEREELSAAPDAGWPDCFNSGVFVYRPSKETFRKLMVFASQQNASFDGGDQGLLNAYFSNWRTSDISRHLPFTYNVTANAFYSYLPAVTRFRNDIHIVHFAGALKPWQLTFNPQNEQLSGNLGGQSDIQREFLLSWWRVMHQHVWPNINQISQQFGGNNKNLGQGQNGNSSIGPLNYGNLTDHKGIQVGSAAHRRAWEAGYVDYYGRDSFDNIQQQLERNIQQNSFEHQPGQQRQISPDKTTTTSILKSSVKEPTPPLQQTTIRSEDVLKKPTTINSQNGFHPSTTSTTTTANASQHLSKESTNTLKSSLKGTSSIPQVQQPTVVSQHVTQLPTRVNVSETLSKQSINPLKSSLNAPIRSSEESTTTTTTTKVSQTVLKESTPLSSNLNKSALKEPTSLSHSIRSSENKTPPATEHASNWTVKSTIVTTYTQGSGDMSTPTVVSKAVSESSATSSNDNPVKPLAKPITDSTKSSGLNLTAKTSSDHFTWLFNKIFVAITYTISLCYLLFLVAIRRSKKTNVIHGTGTTVRGVTPSTNNGNRVNK